jgi:hypothetical protein
MLEVLHPIHCTAKPNLIYTVAFDTPGWRGGRTMAKLLCSSLLRQFWSGQIVVFRNFVEPLFPVERRGLDEIFVETPVFGRGTQAGESCLSAALRYRFLAAEMLDASSYEWLAYLDADCLALRNLDHLFAGNADILVQPEAGRSLKDSQVFNGYVGFGETLCSERNPWLCKQGNGINAGSFAVRSNCYDAVMDQWREIFERDPCRHPEMRDQTAWNRLLLDTALSVKPFERGEIAFPFTLDRGFLDYKQAALLHFVGGEQRDKIELAFALHMMKTYGDAGGLFLDLLES